MNNKLHRICSNVLFLKNIPYYYCSSCNLLVLSIFISFLCILFHLLFLSQMSRASFNEPMSLPALWEGLRKLLIFCTILVFSMHLHFTFGVLFCFILFCFLFLGTFDDTVPFLEGHCILGARQQHYCSGKTIILLQAVLILKEALRHCLRW